MWNTEGVLFLPLMGCLFTQIILFWMPFVLSGSSQRSKTYLCACYFERDLQIRIYCLFIPIEHVYLRQQSVTNLTICQKVNKKNVSKITFIAFIYLNNTNIVVNANKIYFSCFSSYYFRATLALSFTNKQNFFMSPAVIILLFIPVRIGLLQQLVT